MLKAITLPSLLKQTSKEFLWVIRADPALENTSLLESLLAVLRDAHDGESASGGLNVIVFGSKDVNEDVPVPSFRNPVYLEPPILYGNKELLDSYHEAAQTRFVLQTVLDSDDALALDFVDLIQKKAADWATAVAQNQATNAGSKYYRFYCLRKAWEWKHDTPWDDDEEAITADGNPGYLLRSHTPYCITPGLTGAYAPDVQREDVPFDSHAMLQKLLAPCSDETDVQPCLLHIRGEVGPGHLAFRARAMTSSGLRKIAVSDDEREKFDSRQDEFWDLLPTMFGSKLEDVTRMRANIENDRTNILMEALLGLCAPGHSCKPMARFGLEDLLLEDLEKKRAARTW